MLLVAGGSGIVPLMAMVRARARCRSRVPFRLVYSVAHPEDRIYAAELRRRVAEDRASTSPGCTPAPHRRATRARRAGSPRTTWSPTGGRRDFEPTCYVCGPTGFVEAVADVLVDARARPDTDQDREVRLTTRPDDEGITT